MGDREYVRETEKKLPFAPIDFEGDNDQAGKAIREIISKWNVPSAELKKFANGDYRTSTTMLNLKIGDFVPLVRFLGDCGKFVSPEATEYQGVEDICNAKVAELNGMLSRNPRLGYRSATYPVYSMIRELLTEQFLFNLLGKIRELLAAKPVEGTDTEPGSSTGTGTETVPQEQYHPFHGYEDARDSLIKCLHYILVDHVARGIEIDYKNAYNIEPWDALGCFNWASHWSMLYRCLRNEIEKNGPVPEELQFFYGSVELGSRLERITKEEFRRLRECKDQEHIADLFQSILDARAFYGCNYERW